MAGDESWLQSTSLFTSREPGLNDTRQQRRPQEGWMFIHINLNNYEIKPPQSPWLYNSLTNNRPYPADTDEWHHYGERVGATL